MRMLLYLFIFISLLTCCNKGVIEENIAGEWSFSEDDKGVSLILEDGYFIKVNWSCDLEFRTKGKFFITPNLNRVKYTICLIPNFQIENNGDTIFFPCEFIDVLDLSDSTMTIQKLNAGVRSTQLFKLIKK